MKGREHIVQYFSEVFQAEVTYCIEQRDWHRREADKFDQRVKKAQKRRDGLKHKIARANENDISSYNYLIDDAPESTAPAEPAETRAVSDECPF